MLIHFKSDVFTAVAVVIAKTPYFITVKFRLHSHSTVLIFNQLKNLTGHFVHTKLFNIFALFSTFNKTCKSMFAIRICRRMERQ